MLSELLAGDMGSHMDLFCNSSFEANMAWNTAILYIPGINIFTFLILFSFESGFTQTDSEFDF